MLWKPKFRTHLLSNLIDCSASFGMTDVRKIARSF
jgi:hypothetical protein